MNAVIERSAPGVRIVYLADQNAQAGELLDLKQRLIGFTYEDSERKTDKVSLQLDNFDLSLFEREELMGGAVLEVSWGYPGNMSIARHVVVKKLKGFTTLNIEGHATSVLMNQEEKTRAWLNVTRAEIARHIAEQLGYQGQFVDIEDTQEVFDVINQAAETDAHLLRRLATKEEFEFYADANGFHFHKRRQELTPTHVFTWYCDQGRGDLLSLNVESDLIRRAGRVTVRGRDPLRRATIESAAANESAARTTLGEIVEVVDPETGATSLERRNATATVHATAATTQRQVKREASARFRRAERSTIKMSMRVVGDPTVHAKSIVELRGISTLLSGKYYVTDVKHIISSSGYTCDVKLIRDGGNRQARRRARKQHGERNTSQPVAGSPMTEIERVDPETGQPRIEYRRDGRPIGANDPEGRNGN